MKRHLAVIVAALAITAFAGTASAQSFALSINERQHRQEMRIRSAYHQGEITRSEFRRLWAGQQRIRRMERIARRDGFLSPRERMQLQAALDRESRVIARLAHNRRDRNVW